MEKLNNKKEFPAGAVAQLALNPGAPLGSIQLRLSTLPIYRRTLLMLFVYAVITSLLLYLYRNGYVDEKVKNLHVVLIYPCYLMVALHAIGEMSRRRAAFILLTMIVLMGWQFFFHENQVLYSFSFPIAMAPIIIWCFTKPHIVEKLGIVRRGSFIKDLLTAIVIAVVVGAYIVVAMKTWGFGELDIQFWPTVTYTSTNFAENIIGMSLYFAIWSLMKKRGMYAIQGIGIILFMFLVFQIPFLIVHFVTGVSDIFTLFAGSATYSLMYSLLLVFSFSRFKNVLPLAILSTIVFNLARMVGVL